MKSAWGGVEDKAHNEQVSRLLSELDRKNAKIQRLEDVHEQYIKKMKAVVHEQKVKLTQAYKEVETAQLENKILRNELKEANERIEYLVQNDGNGELWPSNGTTGRFEGKAGGELSSSILHVDEKWDWENDSLDLNVSTNSTSLLVPMAPRDLLDTSRLSLSTTSGYQLNTSREQVVTTPKVVQIENKVSSLDIFQKLRRENSVKASSTNDDACTNLDDSLEQVKPNPTNLGTWELECEAENRFKKLLLSRNQYPDDAKLFMLWEKMYVAFVERENVLNQLDAMEPSTRGVYLLEHIMSLRKKMRQFKKDVVNSQVRHLEVLFTNEDTLKAKLEGPNSLAVKRANVYHKLICLSKERKRVERKVRASVRAWEEKNSKKYLFRGVEYLGLLDYRYNTASDQTEVQRIRRKVNKKRELYHSTGSLG
mmetsp:Transcript_4877/g.7383  ORF Transcript_4877/g.7383 Transcript_4877/m.7383 type:complete len:424 (-) Transcript_4877:395-1666(-)|eukprot:CAMPEP_0203755558 /NCGR_PEP_ID=MMETSP0098-20131031/8978_1 /ASSEMBLY_ACC=CAM_ASM_000208 /TAXON_ID=96639 /ORGANISM=" , Strain NY0313808BC1" /LENGTH=423 /DNA_ID=CAMNT_0050647063 /DNA_START=201 /DNA_END=1472 /DNA_ORIENTATION=+